jgi:cytochrome c peroxidase
MIRHHANPARSAAAWTPDMSNLPDVPWLAVVDFAIREDTAEMARQAAVNDLRPITLSDRDVNDL